MDGRGGRREGEGASWCHFVRRLSYTWPHEVKNVKFVVDKLSIQAYNVNVDFHHRVADIVNRAESNVFRR